MNIRTLAAIGVAVILMLVGVVVANRSGAGSAGGSPQPTSTTAAQQSAYPVSSDQASTIARQSSPGATITGAPMLVSYQGATVYEVTLSNGMVYVDATSGKVIASTAPNTGTATTGGGQAQPGQGGEGNEGNNQGGDDD